MKQTTMESNRTSINHKTFFFLNLPLFSVDMVYVYMCFLSFFYCLLFKVYVYKLIYLFLNMGQVLYNLWIDDILVLLIITGKRKTDVDKNCDFWAGPGIKIQNHHTRLQFSSSHQFHFASKWTIIILQQNLSLELLQNQSLYNLSFIK